MVKSSPSGNWQLLSCAGSTGCLRGATWRTHAPGASSAPLARLTPPSNRRPPRLRMPGAVLSFWPFLGVSRAEIGARIVERSDEPGGSVRRAAPGGAVRAALSILMTLAGAALLRPCGPPNPRSAYSFRMPTGLRSCVCAPVPTRGPPVSASGDGGLLTLGSWPPQPAGGARRATSVNSRGGRRWLTTTTGTASSTSGRSAESPSTSTSVRLRTTNACTVRP